MQFSLRERVMYPSHGVAVVDEIVEKKVAGSTLCFYKLSFEYKDMTILIPVNNCEQTGVRFIASAENVKAWLEAYAKEIADNQFKDVDVSPSGWNKRSKDYHDRIQVGTFESVLGVYQELMYIAQGKDLSFGEKTLLHTTEELLTQEIMEACSADRSSALEVLRSPFKQFVISYSPTSHHPNA